MKNLKGLVWLTQLGLSVALPPVCFIYLAIRLQNRFSWGNWVIFAGIMLGILCGVDGLIRSLKNMGIMTREKDKPESPVSFNEHD